MPSFIMIGLAALAASSPAVAAENLACASGLIDAKTNDELFAAYRREEEIGEKIGDKVGKKLAACLLNHDWSEEATESAMRVVFGEILERGFVKEFAAFKGLSMDKLRTATDGYLASLPPEERRKFADGDLGNNSANIYVQTLLVQEAVPMDLLENEAFGRLIGEFAAARANQTVFRAAFEQQ